MKMNCDIIVPIYNAYDYVEECITSVIQNTDLTNNRLILIDDKSSDKKILPLLEKIVEENKNKNITLLKNKKNIGFVKTVNKGMKYSKTDVVLLNSDTEVSNGWLDKIVKCAYSQPKVATVTPLSNNATLVSVPEGLQQNNIPTNITFSEYAKLVEEISYNEGLELPTAHGFCMYIKRDALENIGYFDDLTFSRGYGEENDFSFRALDYGYKNLLCDNTIIYHKGEQSFSTERASLVKENSIKLANRYPIYTKRVDFFCENFPLLHICNNIKYALKIREKRNVLILIHDWKNAESNLGGTTLHVYDLIKNLKNKYNFHVLAPESNEYKLYSYFGDEQEIITFPPVSSANIVPRYNNQYRQMIEKIISAFNISFIHIHHMIGHYFDIADVAYENKIMSAFSTHDLYSINMLYGNNMSNNNKIIEMWQNDWDNMLNKIDYIISPSISAKKEMQKIFDKVNIEVIEHGIDIEKNTKSHKLNSSKYNIAFVGVMVNHKGSNILEHLIRNCKNNKVKIHLFGNTEIPFLKKNRNNYVYHGEYNRAEIVKKLSDNNIDLVCNFSIVPETYSYTLTETIAAGIPILAIDLGAVGERVKSNKIGWTVSKDAKISEIMAKINEIFENKENYNEIATNVVNYKIKTSNEMALDYDKIYNLQKFKKIDKKSIENLKQIISSSLSKNKVVYNTELNWILSSTKWKLISKIKVPTIIKKIGKKIIK